MNVASNAASQAFSQTALPLPIPHSLGKALYQGLQQGKGAFGLAHKVISGRLLNLAFPVERDEQVPLDRALLETIQRRLTQLLERDWQDAEAGVYPMTLLFENDWLEFLQAYPLLCLDMPGMWSRAGEKRAHEFAADLDTSGYPRYYLQNFHYQTDGYLSDRSAQLYDTQVEILFNGAADAMRRRVLAPLKDGLSAFRGTVPDRQLRVLDVGCGTGRTLKFLRATLPKASLFGVDLSAAYLRKANQLLAQEPGILPQLVEANGEALPFRDGYFHAVTSTFLFHELPPEARQNTIDEAFRVLQPGGTVVLCDSIQREDSPELAANMDWFPKTFHEPYYRHYTIDDLKGRLAAAGFEVTETQTHHMSRYWIARKPPVA